MVDFMQVITWIVTAVGVMLLIGAAIGSMPTRLTFALLGIAQAAVLVGVIVDIVALVRGQSTPELLTHIGYLITVPLLIPAGLALTYRKIDRWGLLIVAVATLITAVMVIRQVQTLGIPFGYLNG